MPDRVAPDAASSRPLWWVGHFLASNWASIALFAALLSTLSLQTLTWPWGVRVSGDLLAGAVTLRLAEDMDAAPDLPIQPPEADLKGTKWLRPPIELSNERAASSVRLSATALRLSELHLGRGIILSLEQDPSGQMLLRAGGAGGTLDFEADGPLTLVLPGAVLAGADKITGLRMAVGTEIGTPEQIVLRARTGEALALDDVPVSLLSFGREQQIGQGFVSSIVSGSFNLVDIGDLETLQRGAALQLQDFRGEMFRLEGVEGGYRISFAGRADRVRLGPPGFAEDKTPSMLLFLYHQESIKLMWLSALAFLAAIAKVRSWIIGAPDD